jgi:hypothetical protein
MSFSKPYLPNILAVFLVWGCLPPGLVHAAEPQSEAAANGAALQSDRRNLEDQIRGLRAEVDQLTAKKTALWAQLNGQQLQKRVADLKAMLSTVAAQLETARKNNAADKISRLGEQQTKLQSELALQQELLGLDTQLQAARAGGQEETVRTLQDQIKAKHAALRALHPPIPPAAGAKPVFRATPRVMLTPPVIPTVQDPAVRSVLDQINLLDTQIKADQAKIAELQVRQSGLQEPPQGSDGNAKP